MLSIFDFLKKKEPIQPVQDALTSPAYAEKREQAYKNMPFLDPKTPLGYSNPIEQILVKKKPITLKQILLYKEDEKLFEWKSELKRSKRLTKTLGESFVKTSKELPKGILDMGIGFLQAGIELPVSFGLEIAQQTGLYDKGRIKIPVIGELRSLEEQMNDWVEKANGDEAVAALGFTSENFLKIAIFANAVGMITKGGYQGATKAMNTINKAQELAYKRLGVKSTADTNTIKQAYRDLARKYHPDKAGGNVQKFKEVKEAYEFLNGTSNVSSDSIIKSSESIKNVINKEIKPIDTGIVPAKPQQITTTPVVPPQVISPIIPKELQPLAEKAKPVVPKPEIEKEFFAGLQFKEPTIIKLLTPQTYYSQILGLKPLVEPLELAKQEFDLAFRNTANGIDKMINVINKIGKTTLKEKTKASIKNVPTEAVKEMRNLLDTYEEAPASLSPEKKEIFDWFRNLNREMLKAENAVRTELELEPIKYRKAYVRHVADTTAQEMLEGLYPFPPELAYWSDQIISGKIYNPMEMQRKLSSELEALWTKDLAHATKSMVWTALKEIHLSKPLDVLKNRLGLVNKDPKVYEQLSPIEKEFYSGIRAMPNATKKWLTDYVNQVIKGHETNLDRSVNNLVTQTGLNGLFNKVLKPFGRVVGRTPVTDFEQLAGRALIHGVLGPFRPKLLIRNKFQLIQNLAFWTLRANMMGFLPASVDKNLEELLDKSLFLKTYTGAEELPTNLQAKLEKVNLAAFQWTARTNAQQTMKVAYWDTKDLVVNPKYKDFGWADLARTYNEPKDFLYPSEKEKILKEMEFGASATQYHYIPMGMPEVFRNKALVPLTKLQSWWMNHFFKFHREAIARTFKGETGYGSKLPWSRRIGWFRYLILGGMILNTLGYERSYLLGTAPSGIPPTAQLPLSIYKYITTLDNLDEGWAKRQNAEAKKSIFYNLKTFIPGYLSYKDFMGLWSGEKSLKDYFFYTKYKKAKELDLDLDLNLDLDLDLDI